jgi:hypothetical protein
VNKLFLSAIALVTVFSMPASAVEPAPGYHPPQFRAYPNVSGRYGQVGAVPAAHLKNTEANSEQRQLTEQRSQGREANEQVNVPELQLVDE